MNIKEFKTGDLFLFRSNLCYNSEHPSTVVDKSRFLNRGLYYTIDDYKHHDLVKFKVK